MSVKSDEKAAALVAKLLKLAAPDSGASEAERASAALEACKLIAENNLSVATQTAARARRAPTVTVVYSSGPPVWSPSAAAPSPYGWDPRPFADTNSTPFRPARAPFETTCGVQGCARSISEGESVWRRTKNGSVEYVCVGCGG